MSSRILFSRHPPAGVMMRAEKNDRILKELPDYQGWSQAIITVTYLLCHAAHLVLQTTSLFKISTIYRIITKCLMML